MRSIAHYMTRQPWSVQLDDSISVARHMLAEREIRHLPILDGDELVGMVVERDLVAAAEHMGTVADVMTSVRAVDAGTPLSDVLELMAERRSDAVVVTREGRVDGIFTAMDAVRVLQELIRRRAA
jgi:acetoin utilization protein AcuB